MQCEKWEVVRELVRRVIDRNILKTAIDTGAALLTWVFFDEIAQRLCSLRSHQLYLNAVLGCGTGGALLLLLVLSVAQISACAVLLVPRLYRRVGAAAPSTALGITLGVELVLYHGYADVEIALRTALALLALALIALLRRDAKARASALGAPISGLALTIESHVREACTRAHAMYACPMTGAYLLLRALRRYDFWNHTGAAHEMKRNSFNLCMAACAVLSLLAGQDRGHGVRPYAYLERTKGL